MITKKAGTILLNLKTKQIGLVYRESKKDYSFPKGHLEENESLLDCAVRETEEETLRANHLLINKEIYILKYITPLGENVENYMFISIDDGPSNKNISEKDREILKWVDFNDVEATLSYDDLKKMWLTVKDPINNIFKNNGIISTKDFTNFSICPD